MECESNLPWKETSVDRSDAAGIGGIANGRRDALAHARDLTNQLEAGTIGRTRYDKGDAEIEVEWYHRDISGGDERRVFKRWARDEAAGDPGPEETTTYSFNSTQLRRIDVTMQPVQPVGGVPLEVVRVEAQPVRRSLRQAAAQFVRKVVYAARRQRATPPEQLWEIPAGEESLILLMLSLNFTLSRRNFEQMSRT